MTSSNGVTLQHSSVSLGDVHPRLDVDTISILSSQSDSIQHLSYNESDDEGKGLVTSRLHDTINQTYQPSALKKDWIMYLTKAANGNDEESSSEQDSSSSGSDDEDELDEDPWSINTAQREYYTKQFQKLQKDPTEMINGQVAKEFFERSNLPTAELSQIWNLSDINHDGALSLPEFCTAMHLVVLRLNAFQLPKELPPQLLPFTPLIDLSDSNSTTTNENWANFQSTDSPKQFTYDQPVADNQRIVAPVPVRLSLPTVPSVKPPPPPPRAPGRTASMDTSSQQPILPPRNATLTDTPQRNANQNSSTNTTPYLHNRTQPTITSTPHQTSDASVLLGQIRDLLQPESLDELSSVINVNVTTEQYDTALNQLKARNSVLKKQLKHWEDRLTDLIDKRISFELQLKQQ